MLGSVAAKSLSPYGGPTVTPELAHLATAGTAFDAHRATTGYTDNSVVHHGVLDAGIAFLQAAKSRLWLKSVPAPSAP